MLHALAKSVRGLTPSRRWAQFSLGTVLTGVALLALVCGLVTNRARRQREAVEAIRGWGGLVGYDSQQDGATKSRWRDLLRDRLGQDYVDRVVSAGLPVTPQTSQAIYDERLRVVAALRDLRFLSLNGTHVGDAGLKHLERLTVLESLDAGYTNVGDAGLSHLKRLTRLTYLSLRGTRVTDAGLAELCGVANLRSLALGGTQVTAAGVARLQKALPNCKIAEQALLSK